MGINFTEAIRKSNIAKQKVIEIKAAAEDIKAALAEKGMDVINVEFENLANFIREADIVYNAPETPEPEEPTVNPDNPEESGGQIEEGSIEGETSEDTQE